MTALLIDLGMARILLQVSFLVGSAQSLLSAVILFHKKPQLLVSLYNPVPKQSDWYDRAI